VRQLPPAAWSDLPRARVPARRTSERSGRTARTVPSG